MTRLSLGSLALISAAAFSCTTLPAPKQSWYSFPKDAYVDEGIRPHTTIGSVRARTEFPSLDPENEFEKLCQSYFNKSVEDLVKSAKEKGADAVINVRSVVFLETGTKETYKTAECADDGEEGQSLAEGLAVKWASSEAAPIPISRTGKPADRLRGEEQAYAATNDEARRFALLDGMARDAFDAGESAKARDYAEKLLKAASAHKGQWAYGNAIHRGNLVLGRLALREGDVVKAKTYLLLAGKTPGSPQLDSFGPNMSLAKELLEKGERQIVLDYLELCAKFWHDDFARKQLADWKSDIQAGRVPDFWAHLHD